MTRYPRELIYFMWSYQVHFRIACQTEAEELFNGLDRNLRPFVFLVGFQIKTSADRPPICIEPEDLYYGIETFEGIEELARQRAESDEDKNMLYSGPGMQEEMDQRFKRRMFKEALEHRLNSSNKNKGTICFATSGVPIGNYLVFIVLELNRLVYESHQHLKQNQSEHRVRLFRSFVETSLYEFLGDKGRYLYLPSPGKDLIGDRRESSEILRSGAKRFILSIATKGENFHGIHRFFDVCNELSIYRYENAENFGRLILASRNSPFIEMTLEVDVPFEVDEFRKTRKMLELTKGDIGVICDSHHVLGLGRVKSDYEPSTESVFTIYFRGIHCWDVFHENTNILQMRYGVPQFPKDTINKENFYTDARRHFSGIANEKLVELYELSVAATKQKKGAMLVISDKAKEEAQRFGKRCIPIKPIKLDKELLLSLTSIDGGVLIDPNSNAFAKGVILDGVVGHRGDAGRGSRYNSAVTYCEHTASRQSTMIVVVSSDGMVDIVPDLMPQIKRSEITSLIDFLEQLNTKNSFNRTGFYRTMELLINRRFYLRENEVQRVNKLKNDLQELDETYDVSMRRVFDDFQPNPEMNNSYYLPE